MLNPTQTIKVINHCHISFPDVCCIFPRLMAKSDSKTPPIINNNQLMFIFYSFKNTLQHKKSIPPLRTRPTRRRDMLVYIHPATNIVVLLGIACPVRNCKYTKSLEMGNKIVKSPSYGGSECLVRGRSLPGDGRRSPAASLPRER